jgi:hypothetical protein
MFSLWHMNTIYPHKTSSSLNMEPQSSISVPICQRCKKRRLRAEDQRENGSWNRQCQVCSGRCKTDEYPRHLIIGKANPKPLKETTTHAKRKELHTTQDNDPEPNTKRAKSTSESADSVIGIRDARPTISSGGVLPPCDECINKWSFAVEQWDQDVLEPYHNAGKKTKITCPRSHSSQPFTLWRSWLKWLTSERESLLLHGRMMRGLTKIHQPVILQDFACAQGNIHWSDVNDSLRFIQSFDEIFAEHKQLRDIWINHHPDLRSRAVSMITFIAVSLNNCALALDLPCEFPRSLDRHCGS